MKNIYSNDPIFCLSDHCEDSLHCRSHGRVLPITREVQTREMAERRCRVWEHWPISHPSLRSWFQDVHGQADGRTGSLHHADQGMYLGCNAMSNVYPTAATIIWTTRFRSVSFAFKASLFKETWKRLFLLQKWYKFICLETVWRLIWGKILLSLTWEKIGIWFNYKAYLFHEHWSDSDEA